MPLLFYAALVFAGVLLAGIVVLGALLVIVGQAARDGALEPDDD